MTKRIIRVSCVIFAIMLLLLMNGCNADSSDPINPQQTSSSSEHIENTVPTTPEAPTVPDSTESTTPTEHEHKWIYATCTLPTRCECGATKGEPIGHTWEYATCTSPAYCRCGATTGGPLGHTWQDATCTQPARCECGATKGQPLGHKWVNATCTSAKTCSLCQITSGKPLGHSYKNGICSNCGASNTSQKPPQVTHTHTDRNSDKKCDTCNKSIVVVIDFYALNDLHGKFCDSDSQPGVDELASYLKARKKSDDNVIILSSGDMWQGAAESNLTNGLILTEWMNAMGFVSMTLGNHEYDWGEDAIKENNYAADFPLLAINIYDRSTGKRVNYCTPSVVVERDGIQIGIIGAIGDCYSSISADRVEDVEFKVGYELTSLVKAEANRLRNQGVDIIVYAIHDGYGSSTSGSISDSKLDDYYDPSLSDGYVDLSFEAHTHQSYVLLDSNGVYHLQAGGENKGISHVEISYNLVTEEKEVTTAEIVKSSVYSKYDDDPQTEALEDKYADIIDKAYKSIGRVSSKLSSSRICNIVSELYLEAGLEKWGSRYDIVLGGGYLNTRSPYDLPAGNVTYSDILSLLPFDNQLVLCKISGKNLKSRFINNSDYYLTYSDYGNSVKSRISNSATYYVVVDMYTAVYSPNKLTIVDYYDEGVYARDLLAEEIKSGRFG